MKTGKKKYFQKIKLMVPLALMSVTLGACSLTSQSALLQVLVPRPSTRTSTFLKTDTSSYFTRIVIRMLLWWVDSNQDGSTANIRWRSRRFWLNGDHYGSWNLCPLWQQWKCADCCQAGDQDKVQIVLDGATMTGTGSDCGRKCG